MNKIKAIFKFIIIILILIILFKYSIILKKSVIEGINLWLYNIFPSLFIMFILNDIIINLNLMQFLNNIISPLFNKIFNLNNYSCLAFILSIFSGTPSAAFILKEMINSNKISIEDANKLISFTFFVNPLFLYNILSLSFSKITIIKIIISHYLANIIIGLLIRKKETKKINLSLNNNSKSSFFKIIPQSIIKSSNILLMILGTIIFYMIISNLVINLFNLPNYLNVILKGLLEISQSLNILPLLQIKTFIKEIITLAIISFGGLSIHTQVFSIIDNTKIKYQNFLIARCLHIIISINLYSIITNIPC